MGKKTRKEKIAAEQRRREFLQKMPNIPTYPGGMRSLDLRDTLPKEAARPKFGYSLPKNNLNSAVAATQNSYSYVTSDLLRILALAALAFCAQFVLWYLLGNRI